MSLYGALGEAVRKDWVVEFGVDDLDGSNPTSATTNVSIQGAVVNLKTKTTLADLTHVVTWFVETATPNRLDIYAWKTTSGSDPTLEASDQTEPVSWMVWGPRI